jgi:hypothetical protein
MTGDDRGCVLVFVEISFHLQATRYSETAMESINCGKCCRDDRHQVDSMKFESLKVLDAKSFFSFYPFDGGRSFLSSAYKDTLHYRASHSTR